MAIQSNASTEEVMKGIKVYSGLTNVNVIAVNPTMGELHALDIKVKSEQNYVVAMGDDEFTRVTFWLKNNDSTFKMDLLVQDKMRTSQNTGKAQWINNIGQSTWSNDAPSYEWWKSEGERHAYVGEETLINFIKCWANVASGDDVFLDTMSNIAKGDTSELKALVGTLQNNQVRVLVGVKDERYQTVYTKHFGRIKPQRDDLFIKSLNDEYGNFNADFNPSLVWGEHVPTIDLITPDTNGELKEDEDWVSEPSAADNGTDKDLPF